MASGQLIPAPKLMPPSLRTLAPEDRMRLWARLVEEGDAVLVAGFRERCGSNEAARAAIDAWLDRQGERHAATALRMLGRTAGGEARHGE